MSILMVKTGSNSLILPGSEEQLIPVLEIEIYPDYDSTTGFHIIALLQVSKKLFFDTVKIHFRF